MSEKYMGSSIGIRQWAGAQSVERIMDRGEGDERIIAWQRDDGVVALETNGEPVFGDEADGWVGDQNEIDAAQIAYGL